MGRGGTKAAAACILGALALAAAGCGSSSHANDPRPQVPTRVSVTIGDGAVLVQPPKVAFGPERHQQIPQNQNHAQPDINTDRPLDVVLVTSNQTDADARLVVRGQTEAESEPVLAHSPGTMRAELPAGTYTISAAGVPGARPGKLIVGPYRASSQNDILQP